MTSLRLRLLPLILLGIASAARAGMMIYPVEAIEDLWVLPETDFRARYAGIAVTSLGLGDEGYYVRYRHENLTLFFGPLEERDAAQKKMWELEAVRDAAIRNRPALSTSEVDFVKYTYTGVFGKRGDGSGKGTAGAGEKAGTGNGTGDSDANGTGGDNGIFGKGSGKKPGADGKEVEGNGDEPSKDGLQVVGLDGKSTGDGKDGTGAGGTSRGKGGTGSQAGTGKRGSGLPPPPGSSSQGGAAGGSSSGSSSGSAGGQPAGAGGGGSVSPLNAVVGLLRLVLGL